MTMSSVVKVSTELSVVCGECRHVLAAELDYANDLILVQPCRTCMNEQYEQGMCAGIAKAIENERTSGDA